MPVDVQVEKAIVHNVLKRLHPESIAKAILESIYQKQQQTPIFLLSEQPRNKKQRTNEPSNEIELLNLQVSPRTSPSLKTLNLIQPQKRILVENLVRYHYVNLVFPKFLISIVDESESPDTCSYAVADPSKPVIDQAPELKVKLSIWNAWVDVSKEVLSHHTQRKRTVKNGRIEIDDLCVHEVSIGHGGYFVFHIEVVDPTSYSSSSSITSWKSDPIIIRSRRSLRAHKARHSDIHRQDGYSK
eukprot:c28500_g1_i1.p1 GENE.c28500_g1_i1~~c28500_g1_i1.p1  ORF type:complete len:268 (+),score=49.01 c28500_g1_i1:76-804(+)